MPRRSELGLPRGDAARNLLNQVSAGFALAAGGRLLRRGARAAVAAAAGTLEATSFYETELLRRTLERLVDFDRINAGRMRFSVGAVNVRTGNFVYFDNTTHTIRPEHVMASGSLPPGFPADRDRGRVSTGTAASSRTRRCNGCSTRARAQDTLAFQVDLWSARGELPRNLLEVMTAAEGDPLFEPHPRQHRPVQARPEPAARAGESSRRAARGSVASAGGQAARADADHKVYNIIQLIYRSKHYEGHSKDYEFSRLHAWRSTGTPATTTRCARCAIPRCCSGRQITDGVFTFDLGRTTVANNARPQTQLREDNESARSPRARVRDAADEPGLSAGSLSVRQPRISRSSPIAPTRRSFARSCPEPLEVDGDPGEVRVHPHAGFDGLRRLHRERPGHPGLASAARKGGYTHCMFLNDHPPIAGGRELWGFPKKLAKPTLRVEIDTLVGTLDYGPVRVATGTMGYKHTRARPGARSKTSLAAPNFLLKIIPHVDGTPRICELVEYYLEDITVKGAWTGPARWICGRTPWRRSPSCRSWRWCRHPHRRRPDARPRQGRPRLSPLREPHHASQKLCCRCHRCCQRHRQGDCPHLSARRRQSRHCVSQSGWRRNDNRRAPVANEYREPRLVHTVGR